MMKVQAPVPIAVVGLRFGRHALLWMQQRYSTRAVQVRLVCDRDPAVAEAVGREFGVPWCTDLDEVLSGPVEAVALFTPPSGRAHLVSRCLRAGKDVMATKPFELDPGRTDAVFSEAIRLGRIIASNSPHPGVAPDIREMQIWQATHNLGRAVALRADATGPYFEVADGSWYDDPIRCPAAPLFRIAIYLIHDAISLLGPVAEVSVMTSRFRTGRPTPDQGVLTLRHESGALSAITASLCVKDGQSWRNALVVNYEQGTIYRNLGGSPSKDGADLRLVTESEVDRGPVVTATSRHCPIWSGEYDWERFAAAIRERQPIDAGFMHVAYEGVRVVEAMTRSDMENRPITLQPASPTFERERAPAFSEHAAA